jgi:hypothetical protein
VWSERRVSWDVIEAQPSRSFVFRWPWHPEDGLVTTVSVAIEASGYGSIASGYGSIALEDGPFPIDQPGALDAWAKSIEGWSEALAMLRAPRLQRGPEMATVAELLTGRLRQLQVAQLTH